MIVKSLGLEIDPRPILMSGEDPYLKLTRMVNKSLTRANVKFLFNEARAGGPIPLVSPMDVWFPAKKKNHEHLFEIIINEFDELDSIHGGKKQSNCSVVFVPCGRSFLVATDYNLDLTGLSFVDMRNSDSDISIKWMDLDTFGKSVIQPLI